MTESRSSDEAPTQSSDNWRYPSDSEAERASKAESADDLSNTTSLSPPPDFPTGYVGAGASYSDTSAYDFAGSYGAQSASSSAGPTTLRERQGFGVVSFVISAIGAALVVLAFLEATWTRSGGRTFHDLHNLGQTGLGASAPWLTKAYFGWLGWVIFGVVAAIALLAAQPMGPLSALSRTVGALLGLAAVVVTFLAFKGNGAAHDVFVAAGPGVYIAGGGFILMAIGALIGPRLVAFVLG